MEVTRIEGDGLHSVLLTRSNVGVSWGFRLSGGQDEGISLKLSKVALESPSGRAGLLPKDLIVKVQGEDVLNRSHEDVVKMIKSSSLELRLVVERGENLIPNMSLLARPEDLDSETKSQNFYVAAATEEIVDPNYRKKAKVFTTAGPPKIETDQYNKPLGLYSAETVARMADTPEIDPKLTGTGENQDRHFIPEASKVLNMIRQDDEKIAGELGMGGYPDFGSTSTSRSNSRSQSVAPISRRGSLLPNPCPLPGMEHSGERRRGSLAVTIGSVVPRNTMASKPSHTSTGQLASLVMDEEDERRGTRKVSQVMQGETAVALDRRLAVSEGRYGDLGYKTIV